MPDPVPKTLACGATIYYMGLPLEMGPLPTFIYFSLSGPESLSLHPYNQPATFLEDDALRVMSISLPFHDDYDRRQVMRIWANEIRDGNDFITPFVELAAQAIDELIECEVIDPEYLTVGGLSRGSFIASHLAAREPRIKALVGFAPLTKLNVSTSFKELHETPIIQKLNLDFVKEALVKRAIRFSFLPLHFPIR